jgi:CubicO group peptidase (beta-lactamase class C family)
MTSRSLKTRTSSTRSLSAAAGMFFLLAASAHAQSIEAVADRLIADRGLGALTGPGCAISAIRDDKPVFSKAYGAADIEQAAPFRLDTVSESGSVAKQFTAAAVLLLVQDGKLRLDDDIRRYLPEMPDYGAPIRISDLLHHTSGIREWATLAAMRGYPRFSRTVYSMDDLLKIVARQRSLNFAPGTEYEYSNSNYGLLTIIIGRVSGMSAAEFGRRRLFEPLGMTQTQWRDDLRRITMRRAIAYRRTKDGFEQAMPVENVYGHGALLTTVGDLQIWNKALLGDGLPEAVRREMLTPGKLRNGAQRNYGDGVFIENYRGHRVVRHSGITAGYTSQLWGFPDDKVSVALLCNVRAGNVGALAGGVADAALGLAAEAQPPRADAMPALGKSVHFRSADGSILALWQVGQRRFVDLFTGSGPMELIAAQATGHLTTATYFGALDLQEDGPNSFVAKLEVSEPIRFVKEPEVEAGVAPDGLYRSAELDAVYRVRKQDGVYLVSLENNDAPDRLSYRLERLNGDTYLARAESDSGYMKSMIATFRARPTGTQLVLSSPVGLEGVSNLVFTAGPRKAVRKR